ncbi:DUF4956 domain-containing protein [Paenibacillus sp. YYML68]|uniref:DUF4956 domain-containing protein n=1 Tax=Paenibacillus sp. YYML68 TaxID=2909250 RepID=UPI0024918E78|nr:DUF4956 domain-containing protein [Paenibacillus sp. YYML68]
MGDLLNFDDIIKKNVLNLESFGSISYLDMVFGLGLSLVIGLFIYYIYRLCYRGVVYSHNYNMTFVLMTVITSLIIMTISTNIVLSLGMVGALSIVRFRTAVKDPMDIIYLFWAVAAGIATGAKMYPLALCGSLVIGATIFFLTLRREVKAPYLVVLRYEDRAEEEVKRQLRRMKAVLKSKTFRKGMIELTAEIKVKDDNVSMVADMSRIDGMIDSAVVSHSGDYAQ